VTARPRDAALDGLRALAALSVLVFHVWLYTWPDPTLPTREGFWNRLLFEGSRGLVLFFVLSGFLLYRPFLRGRVELRSYFARRAVRIAPAYWVALAGAVLLLWGGESTPGIRLPDLSSLGLFAVFGQNFSGATIMQLNPVTWTLCVEVGFYLLLPLVARRNLILTLVAVGLGWNLVVYELHAGQVLAKALPAFLPYFAVGMAVARWPLRRWPVVWAITGAALVAANGMWHSVAAPRAVNPMLAVLADFPAAVGFGLLVSAAAGGGLTWLGRLSWVGVRSYGLYLWHVPLILFLRRLDLLPLSFVPALLLVLPVSLGVAALSWRFVERPALAGMARAPLPRRQALARSPAS
jgi:peptidoglycan/LPS O-acetylase OafA/YrhL